MDSNYKQFIYIYYLFKSELKYWLNTNNIVFFFFIIIINYIYIIYQSKLLNFFFLEK